MKCVHQANNLSTTQEKGVQTIDKLNREGRTGVEEKEDKNKEK